MRPAIPRAIAALLALLLHRPALAQQAAPPFDTVPLRADYRDLGELLDRLPRTTPPTVDAARALWLGALPLACLDRLQSRPGGRAARPIASADTTRAADTTVRGTDARTGGAPGAVPATNSGAGYFWVPTYTVVPDHDRLRAFWGCNDWHSAVGSTWVTVRVLKHFPNGALETLAREKLNAHLGKSNLAGELAFFRATAAASNPIPSASQGGLFERPYGFVWLLALHAELRAWPDTQAMRWNANIAPLSRWMADSLAAYITTLVEPVRTGAQSNTAQSMTIALDYANAAGDTKLRAALVAAARRFFVRDTACATQSERVVATTAGRGGRGGRGGGRDANADSATRALLPNDLTIAGRGALPPPPPGGGGPIVLSPCLTEASLMSLVLEPRSYVAWLDRFLPPLQSGRFAPLTEPLTITSAAPGRDTTGATTSAASIALGVERARLAGLSFARAQSMERIARALPTRDPRVVVWHRLSAIHAERGFEFMRDDSAGSTWLPAQALLYDAVRRP